MPFQSKLINGAKKPLYPTEHDCIYHCILLGSCCSCQDHKDKLKEAAATFFEIPEVKNRRGFLNISILNPDFELCLLHFPRRIAVEQSLDLVEQEGQGWVDRWTGRSSQGGIYRAFVQLNCEFREQQ